MNEIVQFLTENSPFYLATLDGDLPKVRPFGFAMEFDGKLCFCTNNKKDVFKQMQANPNIEISTTSKAGEWLRLKGKAVSFTSKESREAALEAEPFLKKMYSVDDSVFEILCIENAEATISDMKGASRNVKI